MNEEIVRLRIELMGRLLQTIESRNYLISKRRDITIEEKELISKYNKEIDELQLKLDQLKPLINKESA